MAIVFELCPACSANEDNSMVLLTHATRGDGLNILHHDQIVTITYSISVVSSAGLIILYIHDADISMLFVFFCFWAQN